MKSTSKKKLGGFMCNSPAATAVCMTGPDSRAVVIPGRRSSSERNIITNCTANNSATSSLPSGGSRYSKLVDYHTITKLNHNNKNNNDDDNRRHHRHRDQSQAKMIVKSEQKEEQPANSNLTVISGVGSDTNDNDIISDRQIVLRDDLNKSTSSRIDSLTRDNVFQVVVMRVSLHCQGCAGKLKKYIAKMEGVTSFSIELEHKRVTVMGHVSPVVVLENISKVRRAEFWPSSASSTDHYLRHF